MKSPRVWFLVLAVALLSALVAGPTVVSANGPAIQVSSVTVSPDDPVEGETVTFDATIANLQQNSGTVEITDVYLRRSGSTREYTRIEDVGSIAPGGSLTVPLTATFENAGEKQLTVRVVIADHSGDIYTYSYPAAVDVETPVARGDLSTTNGSGGTSVTLDNYGNVNFTNVEVSSVVGGEVRDRRPTGDINPDSNRTVTFDTSDYETDTVTFRATYTANGNAHEVSRTIDLRQQVTGEIRLTSVEVTGSGGGVSIEGDAANIGGTDAESVLVSVRDTDGVTPASGAGEYFIGPIDASEFATFELSADVEPGTASIPVEIAYIVDDERVTTTQRVDIGSAAPNATGSVEGGDAQAVAGSEQAADAGGSGGPLGSFPLVGLGLTLSVLLVAGVAVVRWRDR